MHFLIGAFVVFLLWENPVTRALLLTALVALICFPLLPPVIAVVIVAVVMIGLWAGAAEEMRARREWLEEDALLRRAALRRARRELDR
jgi:Mg2+/citrate symporter